MISPGDEAHLLRALELAQRAGRATAPNPRVGAVVVSQGTIVGEGWHQRAGEPHAEHRALEQAGSAARGATLFGSLEPCSHRGRTPPCTEAILAGGISRVVVALLDPDPRVDGRGLARLRERGVDVELADGPLAQKAAEVVEDYLVHRRQQRSFCLVKLATTLDGRIADRSHGSQWVTGQAARARGRRLRDRYGAILVGAKTVRADDPELLPPTAEPQGGPFLRCVIDGALSVSPQARLLHTGRWSPVLIYTSKERADADETRRASLEAAGAELVPLEAIDRRLAPQAVLRDLARRGVLGVIVEGGGETAGGFFRAGLVDRVEWFVAPRVLGDPDAVGAVQIGARMLPEAWRGRIAAVERVGEDVLLSLYPQRPS
ncbi:MAG: bifunctional diaminohydroxyphosphoribosylaminopyrimidine deaminase/5-amino-6-(5-phosphoribosylamino)uracil reductase RibD [Acidobacteriota bacterium]|nr:MAG: bifunctional diaminohydroxyphosphoribosylaminopyrimidine deaminase/5-amino-6-(5-phosphoribosylamino)uracil reductase RibD [Acidobacteriota bacterium]